MTLAIWFVLAACAIAVATDVTTRRIPNWLTGVLAVAALGFHAVHGWRELLASVLALVVVMFLGFLAFSMGWLGGGDVKLAAVTPKESVTLPYAVAIATGAVAVALSHTAAPFLRLPL